MFRLHHVALSVGDLDRSVDFYSRLGFRPLRDYQAPDGSWRVTHLVLGSAVLELFCFRDASPAPASTRTLATDLPRIGVKHLALEVPELEAAIDRLRELGISSLNAPVAGKTGVRYVFVQDPDGMLLEILEDPLQRKEAVAR